ncbi:hypothetical protein NP493_178g03064 [Ridgeia piscesae]|uniref:CABIT domain-containing protein n=1 Tax=Ridgeia piscesae TaxID=27915 RepID=A0AAD9P2S7_RIDPI|nr:hypothetical protein NP493_178g03064 [Ridgeia piscesae]
MASATTSAPSLNGQPLMSVVEWDTQSVQLRDFADRCSVPNVVRVTKGQYRNIGAAKSQHGSLYVHSVQDTRSVVAECIKVREGKRANATSNQKYAVPMSYQGWFEVLSEDGKAIKPIPSVQDLYRVFPHSCLIRENIKAYITKDNGQLTLDRVRTVLTGEVLRLDGDIVLTVTSNKGLVQRRLLRCVDGAGEATYFAFEQKGAFSPVAGHANISGVHNLKSLLEKFRLPISVRLVHGAVPSKLQRHFTKVFRLLSIYSNQTVFACPLKKDAKMVPISTREFLKVVGATNFSELRDTDECQGYHQRCSKMIDNYLNSIHMLVTNPEPEVASRGKVEGKREEELHQVTAAVSPPMEVVMQKVEEDILFEEIDDIYQYVREGGIVPAPRTRPKHIIAPQSMPIVPMMATKAVHVMQDMRMYAPESTNYTDGATKTKISPPPTTKWDEPIHHSSLEKRVSEPMSPNDTFWEVPMPYEPQDKMGKSKRDDFARSMPNLLDTPDLIASITESTKTKLALHSENPVVNLRQVIKRSSSSSQPDSPPVTLTQFFSDSEKTSNSTGTPYEEHSPPPVPPKCFEELMDAKPEANVKPDVMPPYTYGSVNNVYDSRMSMAVNLSSAYDPPPGGNSRSFNQNQARNHQLYSAPVIASYNMAGGKGPTQIVFNSPHMALSPGGSTHISVTSQPVVSPGGPKYVAVAQVGDSPPAYQRPVSMAGVTHRNAPLQHSNGNRRKLRTMVL